MGSDETQSALSRAYELVEAGQYNEARAILDPILAAEPNNPDAWWVYAHAVTSAEEGRAALENVVRIDPRYPGASQLLAQARDLSPSQPSVSPLPVPPGTIPEESIAEPEDFDSDFDDDMLDTRERRAAQRPEERRGGIPILAVALVLAVIVVVVLLVLPSLLPAPTPTPDSDVASAPTDSAIVVATEEASAPTRRPTITPTIEGATAEVSNGEFPAVREALAAFPLTEGGVAAAQTSLGNTLMVSVCSAPGREMRMLLPQVMNTLATQSPSLDASIQALGVSLINCDSSAPLLTVATEIISAQNYASGDLSDAEFAATWEPQ